MTKNTKRNQKPTPAQQQQQAQEQARTQHISEQVQENLHLSEKQSKKFAAQATALMRNLSLRRQQRQAWNTPVMTEERQDELLTTEATASLEKE